MPLTPVQVLTVLIERIEKRADVLSNVRMTEYNVAIAELKNIAITLKKARDYLRDNS